MKDGKKRFLRLLAFTLASVLVLASLAGCFNKDTNDSSQIDDEEWEAQFEDISKANESIQDLKESDEFLDEDIEEQTELVLKEIQKQAEQGRIKEDTIICDEEEHIITFEYSNGTLGLDIVGGFDEDLDSYSEPTDLIQFDEMFPYDGDGRFTDAIVLYAMNEKQEVHDECLKLPLDWSKAGINTRFDDSVTLEELIDLKEYEFIYFKMHGAYIKYALFKAKTSVILLEQFDNSKTHERFKNDIKKKRVGIASDNTYFVTADFFDEHYDSGDFNGSIFFLGCCELMGANDSKEVTDWTDVFDDIGVSAFVAFYNKNYSYYNIELVDAFLKNLIDGKTAKESYDAAVDLYGETDNEWHLLNFGEKNSDHLDAYPILKGDNNTTLMWEYVPEGTSSSSSSETPTPTPIPTPTPTPTPEPVVDKYVGYREVLIAYEEKLREVEGGRPDYGLEESLNSCALTDLTGDGFPELIVLSCSNHLYDFRLDGLVYADVNVYTILPGETSPTLMLNIPKFVVTQGMYLSDLVVLTDGTLMLYTYSGMTSYYESYIQYKYSPDENAFIQANQLDYACVYNGETGDEEISFTYNGGSISESDYYGLAESYTYMFDLVLFKNPKYENYSSLTNWENACLNAPDCSMNFDMAWDLIVPVHNTDSILTQDQASEAFENYWAATFEWDSDYGGYQTPFGMNTIIEYSEYYSDDYTCVYKLTSYEGAQAWFYVYYFMDLSNGSVYTVKYEDSTWSAVEYPDIVMYGIELEVFNAFDYI